MSGIIYLASALALGVTLLGYAVRLPLDYGIVPKK